MRITSAFLMVLLTGCGGKNPGAYTTAGQAATGADNPALTAADALWAERADASKLQQALAKYEEAYAADPANRHVLIQLTRGWYFYGDAHTTEKEPRLERWSKAIDYGKKCIALNKAFADKVNAGAKEKDAVSLATKDDVPCLYWTATALGKWAKAQSLSKTLKFLPTVKAYVGKAEELDPTYYHYGPSRYWGAYYAILPSFAGQDATKSGEYFEASIAGAPYYFPTRVLRAEFLRVLEGDVKGFDADLDYVINGDPNTPEAVNGDVAPENIMEIEKAKALLAKKHELFDKKALEAAGQ